MCTNKLTFYVIHKNEKKFCMYIILFAQQVTYRNIYIEATIPTILRQQRAALLSMQSMS